MELRPQDNTARLRSLGLRIKSGARGRVSKFLQPCAAYDGCKCGIYSERPLYCREFECLLLKNVHSGVTNKETALSIIKKARQRLDTINDYLCRLGNKETCVPHRVRFNQVAQMMDDKKVSRAKVMLFSKLTILVHELNVLMAEHFYPGAQQRSQ